MLHSIIRTAFLALIVLFLLPVNSLACSCAYKGEFIKYSKGHTVIRGKVDSYGQKLRHGKSFHETMKVSVVELVQGSFEHPTIEFIGDPGHLCLTYVDSNNYPIGSEHLFTVLQKDKKQGLGGCGEVSVLIVEGKVNGRKLNDSGDQWMRYSIYYDEFIQAITGVKPATGNDAINQVKSSSKPWWKFWK